MNISKFSHLTKLKGFGVGLHFPNDDTDEETEERLCRYSEYNRWYGSLESLKNNKGLDELAINATDIDAGLKFLPKNMSCLY